MKETIKGIIKAVSEPKYTCMSEVKTPTVLYYAKVQYTIRSARVIGSSEVVHKYTDTINVIINEGIKDYELLEIITSKTNYGKIWKFSNPIIIDKIKLGEPKDKLLTGWSRRFL